MRVSLNSSDKDLYNAYFRPRGYQFSDVLRSIQIGKENGLIACLNLLVFPGVTDTLKELEGLSKMISDFKIDAIQMRNLSIDPKFYLRHIPTIENQPMGVLKMINELKNRFAHLKFGYFNRPKHWFL